MRSAPSAARLLVYFLAMAPGALSLVGCEEPHVAHNSALCADCQKRRLAEECQDNQSPEPIRNLREPMTAVVGPEGGLALPPGVQPRDFFRGENGDPAALRANEFRVETKADGLHIIALDKCRASAEFFLAKPGSGTVSGPGAIVAGIAGNHGRGPSSFGAPAPVAGTVGGGCAGGACAPSSSGAATAGGILDKPVLPVPKAPDAPVADTRTDLEKTQAHQETAIAVAQALAVKIPILQTAADLAKKIPWKETLKPKVSDDSTPGEPDGQKAPAA